MSAKSNQFFLGKIFDLKSGKITSEVVNYDPPDLTTHAVVTGMTGSGKTGLCISLLEEAALQGIPAIIVDPKGDLTNLMLHFPELRPEDFEPWLDPDNARREGKPIATLAAETAAQWRKGLDEWGMGKAELQALADAADRCIYTPGSTAGIPVNILASFAAPQMDWDINQELLRDKIASTITALLTLVGMRDIDPLRSREHILLSNIVEHAWQEGKSLTLQEIIYQTQDPPFNRLGAFEVNAFFPKRDREDLAFRLNNFLASPSFQTWIEGQPLDAEQLLYKDGKPRQSIFYLAHLDETERMFFVTLLFAAVESWMHTQRGTSNLRALIYFDEILGYLPPVAVPASKPIIVRMVKMARAFGVGLVLTTQNPVDVDYKALSNAGTWLIGRLQTDQDKQRLLDGLESAAGGVERSQYDRLISSLPKRVFLYKNIHEKNPVIFYTRWAMDYLAGPLTLTQIPALNKLAGVKPFNSSGSRKEEVLGGEEKTYIASGKPQVPIGIDEYFLPDSSTSGKSAYRPGVLAQAEVNIYSRSPNFSDTYTITALVPQPPSGNVNWGQHKSDEIDLRSLPHQLPTGSRFNSLPDHMNDTRWWQEKSRDFENWIYETGAVTIRTNKSLNVTAGPEVSLEQFKEMCHKALAKGATGNSSLDNKRAVLQRKIDAQETKVQQCQSDVTHYNLDTGGQAIKTVWNVLTRGRTTGASSALSANRRRSNAQTRLNSAKEELARLQQEMANLSGSPDSSQNLIIEDYQEIKIAPSKRDIVIKAFGLVWLDE